MALSFYSLLACVLDVFSQVSCSANVLQLDNSRLLEHFAGSNGICSMMLRKMEVATLALRRLRPMPLPQPVVVYIYQNERL